MSYSVDLVDSVFEFSKNKQAEALATLWPNLDVDWPKLFSIFGYTPEYHIETGNITNLKYSSSFFGVDKAFFELLAPYVTASSYLQYQGEDGARWRWVFTDGKMIEVELKKGYAR